MLVAALALVACYGDNVPWWDDWVMVPAMTHAEPITLEWILRRNNEHYIPLPKVLYLGLVKLGGGDFRAGMYFQVIALGALALAFMQTARTIRGRTIYADAIFPVVLLHGGMAENFLWCFQVQHTSATLLAGMLLLVIARSGMHLRFGSGLVAGMCLALLPLAGGAGLAYVPALAVWFACATALRWRFAGPHVILTTVVTILAIVPTLLVTWLYFRNHEHDSLPAAKPAWDCLTVALQFLTVSLGPGAGVVWEGGLEPRLSALWPASGFVLLVVLLAGAGVLVVRLRREQGLSRSRALGLCFFLAAVVGLALVIGWGRGDQGETIGFRYVTLAPLLVCCLYFAWGGDWAPSTGAWAQTGLFVLAVLMLPLNVQQGLNYAEPHHRGMAAFEKDVRSGDPIYWLLARHTNDICPEVFEHTYLEKCLHMLHRAGFGFYGSLQDSPPFHRIPLAVESVALHHARWQNGAIKGQGKDAYFRVALPEPRFIAGIRIAFSCPNTPQTEFRLAWRRRANDLFPENPQFVLNPLRTESAELIVYVGDSVSELRFYPDKEPWIMKVKELSLLIPAAYVRPKGRTTE
jgi:hypothetical protein